VSLLRRRRNEPPPLEEADVYAHSYGERSDEVTNVKPVPQEAPAPAEEAERRLTDRKIRDAFRTRLDRRDPS
jgi:hypothetical protein